MPRGKQSKQTSIKKPAPLGRQVALTLTASERSEESVKLTYWDLWMVLAAETEFEGELDRLGEHFREQREASYSSRGSSARKLSHLRDLQRRLAQAGVTVQDVMKTAGALTESERARARGRVLRHEERAYELSFPMLRLPVDIGEARARYGLWPRFPADPEHYHAKIEPKIARDFYPEERSHALVSKLDVFADRAESLLSKGQAAQAQALLRALLTAYLEVRARADDSYGAIGDGFERPWRMYLDIPLEDTGIEEEVFFADLLEYLVWENFGFTHRIRVGYFERLTESQTELCMKYLRRRVGELRADDLDWESEHALTLLGLIAAEQARLDLVEDLAREMGARVWERIMLLADCAVKSGKQPLAEAVFEAALTEGWHLDFLRKKYEQLKRGKWNPDPRA